MKTFGPLPPPRALYLVRQICRSLSEAHSVGLIHRDIKPANIYVCRMGIEYDFVKVLDFGLARHEYPADAVSLTAEPMAGTPAYMAPETILGEEPDRRVDIYAIGCLLRFLLTGEPVFSSQHRLQLLLQHLQEPPTPPSHSAGQPIPSAVDELVLACLQKDPACRPTSVDEVLRRASASIPGDMWDQEAARQWWEKHLPDHCGRSDLTFDPRVAAPPRSARIVPRPPIVSRSARSAGPGQLGISPVVL